MHQINEGNHIKQYILGYVSSKKRIIHDIILTTDCRAFTKDGELN